MQKKNIKKIRFYTNKDLDKFMALQFFDEKAAGVDFGKGIIKTHPKLKKAKELDKKEREKIINQYFDRYYKINKKNIQRSLKLFINEWRKKEKDFFNITNSLFNNFQLQKGMYICYLSIIDCNPRFLESKTFQVFYKKDVDEAIQTIAHELLHFIFFDFLNKNLKKESQMLSEEKIWDLSEIFNIIILKSDSYSSIINKKTIKPYPEHIKYLSLFEETYKQSIDIEKFIINGIKILTKNKKERK